jgi:hypothetical protein
MSVSTPGRKPKRSLGGPLPVISCTMCEPASPAVEPLYKWFLTVMESKHAMTLSKGVAAGQMRAALVVSPGFLFPSARPPRPTIKMEYVPAFHRWWPQPTIARALATNPGPLVPGIRWKNDRSPATKVMAVLYVHNHGGKTWGQEHLAFVFYGALDAKQRSKARAVMVPLNLAAHKKGTNSKRLRRLAMRKDLLLAAAAGLHGLGRVYGLMAGHKSVTPFVVFSRLVAALTGQYVGPRYGEMTEVNHRDMNVWHNCAFNLQALPESVHKAIGPPLAAVIAARQSGSISGVVVPPGASQGAAGGAGGAGYTPYGGAFSPTVQSDPEFVTGIVVEVLALMEAHKRVPKTARTIALRSGLLPLAYRLLLTTPHVVFSGRRAGAHMVSGLNLKKLGITQ